MRVDVAILILCSMGIAFIHIIISFYRVIIVVTWTHLIVILRLGYLCISLLELVVRLVALFVSSTVHLSFLIIINLI